MASLAGAPQYAEVDNSEQQQLIEREVSLRAPSKAVSVRDGPEIRRFVDDLRKAGNEPDPRERAEPSIGKKKPLRRRKKQTQLRGGGG